MCCTRSRLPQIIELLRRALADPLRGLGNEAVDAPDAIIERIAIVANGDARAAYNTLEALVMGTPPGPGGKRAVSEARLERRAAEEAAALR